MPTTCGLEMDVVGGRDAMALDSVVRLAILEIHSQKIVRIEEPDSH